VIFDSSVVFTKDRKYFLNKPVTSAILEAQGYTSLIVNWYIPKIAFLERIHRRRQRVEKLADNIQEIQDLTGQSIDIKMDMLQGAADSSAYKELESLSIHLLEPDWSLIDWNNLTEDAAFRIPPFGPGDSEKGFRDAIIIETYLQHAISIVKEEGRNNSILVTEDKLMAKAVLPRIKDLGNSYPPATFDELRSLIATLLAELQEALVARLIPKATALFYTPGDHSSLFIKEGVQEQIQSTYSSALTSRPPGSDYRINSPPNLSRSRLEEKKGDRFFWANRIIIGSVSYRYLNIGSGSSALPPSSSTSDLPSLGLTSTASPEIPRYVITAVSDSLFSSTDASLDIPPLFPASGSSIPSTIDSLPVSEGVTSFDVLWSSHVTDNEVLTDIKLEGITYVDTQWN
ncbi:hypothetical protein C5S36_03295, partial [Candidatus Methanophagaceae archaeon]